jgi:hypothetical protein
MVLTVAVAREDQAATVSAEEKAAAVNAAAEGTQLTVARVD